MTADVLSALEGRLRVGQLVRISLRWSVLDGVHARVQWLGENAVHVDIGNGEMRVMMPQWLVPLAEGE